MGALFQRLALPLPTPSTPPPHLPRHDGEEPTQAGRFGQVRGHPPVQIHTLGPGTLRRHGSSELPGCVCSVGGVRRLRDWANKGLNSAAFCFLPLLFSWLL